MRKHFPLAVAPFMMSVFFAVLSLSASTDGEAFKPPAFDRYQPILDRMPFGALPENFSLSPQDVVANQLAAKAQAEQDVLKKKVKMSVVNITPAGATAIGFTDMSVNPPVNHYVKVGDKSGDWTVLSADYSKGVAVIEKDGVSVDLSLQEAAASAATAESEKAKDAPNVPRITRRAKVGGSGRSLARGNFAGITVPDPKASAQQAAAPSKPDAVSYAERLRERAARKTQEQMAADAKMREQFEKLARETAAKEIQRREEEALREAQEAAEQQQWAEQQQQPQAVEAPPAVIQEGNIE
jgi:hypothetical protein